MQNKCVTFAASGAGRCDVVKRYLLCQFGTRKIQMHVVSFTVFLDYGFKDNSCWAKIRNEVKSYNSSQGLHVYAFNMTMPHRRSGSPQKREIRVSSFRRQHTIANSMLIYLFFDCAHCFGFTVMKYTDLFTPICM